MNIKVKPIEKHYQLKNILNKLVRPCLKDIINKLKIFGTWEIQLKIAINFTSSKYDNDAEQVMYSKSGNIEIIINDEADEVIRELFDSLKNRYQNRLEESVKGSDLFFNCVRFLYYKCHKTNPNRGESYMGSPDWIKDKKATINPINKKDNKYFQYAVTVSLNHEKITEDPQKITKIKLFINKYNWKGTHFPSEKVFCVLYAKKDKKNIQFMFQNKIQIVKRKLFF